MSDATANQGYLYSRLAADADLGEIVDMFVEEMPTRVATLLEHVDSMDWESLRRTAHQLKGAAGSYGFEAISPAAGKVEAAVRDGEPEERIREMVQELVGLCKLARSGLPTQQG